MDVYTLTDYLNGHLINFVFYVQYDLATFMPYIEILSTPFNNILGKIKIESLPMGQILINIVDNNNNTVKIKVFG